jgi:hypothetical protein
MDIRFTTPSLRKLDQLGTEVLAATIYEDVRPPRGVVGLLDWRLAGKICRLTKSGVLTGRLGEVLLVPARPRLPFDKILLFGAGETRQFDEEAYVFVVERMLSTMEGLRARTAVVELPGRQNEAILADRATELLLGAVGGHRDHDVWTLIESADGQRAIKSRRFADRSRLG